VPIYTTAITGSTGTGVVQFSGSMKTAGFLSALGVGNASVINHPTTIPEDYNSLLYGPITVKHTGSLTISSGAAIKIKDLEDA
jgi:archaellum component FlaG (FlaF/FlaG flagellin family)